MSLLNEFFAAEPAAITADLLQRGPAGRFATVGAAGLTELELALLLVAIEGQPDDAAIARLGAFEVTTAGPEGPWVVRLPDALREALARATPADRRRVAERWGRAEELAGAAADDLAALLERLAPLARDGLAAGTPVYLWVSL
jgi:hypothetical protein